MWGAESPHIFYEQPYRVSSRLVNWPPSLSKSECRTLPTVDQVNSFILRKLRNVAGGFSRKEQQLIPHAQQWKSFRNLLLITYIISRSVWYPRSPDISSPDFHLLGFLRADVYKNYHQILEEGKRNIETCISRNCLSSFFVPGAR